MHLSRRASLISVCAVLVVGAFGPAAAQFVPSVSFTSQNGDGAVIVNNRTAIRFRVPNGDLTPLQRAEITAGRIKPLAAGGWKAISAKAVGTRRAQVVAEDQLICIVTEADAKANGTSAYDAAESWARNLRWLFSLPPIAVTPQEMTVPENETRRATIDGAAVGPFDTTDGNAAIATSTVDQAKRTVVVTGKAVGRSTVDVSCQGCRTTLVVNVKRYAAKTVRTDAAEITGNPAPASLIEEAASQLAPRVVAVQPGASAVFGKPKSPESPLSRGTSARLLVPVKASGPGLIPVELLAPVEVFNIPVSHKPPTSLFYSNNPERVTRYETLFTGQLIFEQPSRLLYHHQNMLGKRVRFVIELINSGATDARVLAISGISPPLVDTVVVGYLAGNSFVKGYLGDIGRVHRIPPKSRLLLYACNLDHINTASGIIDLRQMSGENVFVRVAADVPAADEMSQGDLAQINDAYVPTGLSEDVYTAPSKRVDAKYVVGDRWAFIRIGKEAIKNHSASKQLYGNYGVIYELHVRIENPTAEARNVQVLFEPTAGPAGAIFVLGGQILGTKIVVPPNEFKITEVRLEPGQAKDIKLLTMPLSGSAYPATIVVRQ